MEIYRDEIGNILEEWELQELHDDLLDDVYGDVTIGIYTWATSRVLKEMDPIAYRISFLEYVDQRLEDETLTVEVES